MKQGLQLRMGQQLSLTPQLQQAIRLLQLSSTELSQEVADALESNLMLEVDPETGNEREQENAASDGEATNTAEAQVTEAIPEALPVDADWTDIYDNSHLGPSKLKSSDDDWPDLLQTQPNEAPSLRDHLNWQVSVAPFSEKEQLIAANIADTVDDEGYLSNWEELCQRLMLDPAIKADQASCESVLAKIQQFDPPGVAARNLSECLGIQLQQLEESIYTGSAEADAHPVACIIVERCLELLGANKIRRLREITKANEETLNNAISMIRHLQPRPGAPFSKHEANYVKPDLIVARVEDRWVLRLNPEITPRLRVNPEYLPLIKRSDKSDEQQCLKEHLVNARALIAGITSRYDTLLRVGQVIVEEQRAFLDYGEEALKPMVLRDVAESLEIHESTVSRATAQKYLLTPRGLFELKFFFSSHVKTSEGGACSAVAIQAMIRRLIGAEAPKKPLSDSALTRQLNEEGIEVARRTVAKYREALGIPPSHQRKLSA